MKHGWKRIKFAEAFELQMGKTPSRDNPSFWNGVFPWVSISDLKGKYIRNTKEQITDKALECGINKVHKGTVIMSFKLTVGRAAIADCDLYTNEAIMSFVPKPGYDILTDYLYYYLRGHKWIGANKAVMGQTLNKKSISDNVFVLPPLPVQEQICSLLDKMNRVIEAKKEQLKELDNLAQAIFYDMFGDPVENNRGWGSRPISSIGELSRGVSKHRPRNAPELLGGTMPLLQTGDVSNSGMYIRDYTSTYSELGILQSRVWHKGTLCITIAANIGKCSILTFDACFPDSIVGFIPFDNVLVEYMFFAFSAIQKTLEENAMGVAQKNINLAILNQLVLAVPPLDKQQAFAEKVEAIERQKELINQSLREVQTLFDSRMDYWFSEEDDDFGQLDKLD